MQLWFAPIPVQSGIGGQVAMRSSKDSSEPSSQLRVTNAFASAAPVSIRLNRAVGIVDDAGADGVKRRSPDSLDGVLGS